MAKINLSSIGKVTAKSLTKHSNGTATVDALIIYAKKKPVYNVERESVTIDEKFVTSLANRYNKDHSNYFKRLLKPYPKVIMEHQDTNINAVSGRLNSPIQLSYEHIEDEGESLVAKVNILLTEPKTISEVESGKLRLSAGMDWDNRAKEYFLDELTLTTNPQMKHAILLSESDGEVKRINLSGEIAQGIKEAEIMLERVKELEAQIEDVKLNAENETKQAIRLSNHRIIDARQKLQLFQNLCIQNKILRRDVPKLMLSCKDIPVDNLEKIFNCVSPNKLNMNPTFTSHSEDMVSSVPVDQNLLNKAKSLIATDDSESESDK